VDVLAVVAEIGGEVARLTAEEGGEGALFQINLFWVAVSAINFLLFFAIIWTFAFKPVSKMLDDRRARIEQGLQDAEQARRDRDSAEAERVATLTEARREANEIINRAQKVAQETRDADIAATREELERMRVRATADIEAERRVPSPTCVARSPTSHSPRRAASSARRCPTTDSGGSSRSSWRPPTPGAAGPTDRGST
jgi:ATP synthase F0 subunit b